MSSLIIQIQQIPIDLKKQDGWYISSCKALDVYSQGKTQKQAKNNLAEALFLFFLSCFERGTLDDVLKDCGFEVQRKAKVKTKVRQPHLNVEIPLGIRATSI